MQLVEVDVLLAEDNRADIIMLTEAMQQAGLDYRLHVAADGRSALDLLDRHNSQVLPRLGLIILDLNLPRLSGLEILRVLRSRPELGEIPTVVLTTSAWEDFDRKLGDFDHKAFFQKPSLLEDWVAVVQAIETYRVKNAPSFPRHHS
jgi:CheY-like chemotaxis protein